MTFVYFKSFFQMGVMWAFHFLKKNIASLFFFSFFPMKSHNLKIK